MLNLIASFYLHAFLDNLDSVKKGKELGSGPLLYPWSPGDSVCPTLPHHGPWIRLVLVPVCWVPMSVSGACLNSLSSEQVVHAWVTPHHLLPRVRLQGWGGEKSWWEGW